MLKLVTTLLKKEPKSLDFTPQYAPNRRAPRVIRPFVALAGLVSTAGGL